MSQGVPMLTFLVHVWYCRIWVKVGSFLLITNKFVWSAEYLNFKTQVIRNFYFEKLSFSKFAFDLICFT